MSRKVRPRARRIAVSAAAPVLLLLAGACGSDARPTGGVSRPPAPAPLGDKPTCVLSADCPAGQHCDLGECAQECHSALACDGTLTCSPRARCTPAGAPAHEPPPSPAPRGLLSVEPSSVRLPADARELRLRLSSSGPDIVRYRIELSGPHLSLENHRGSFTRETEIVVHVDARGIVGAAADGSVRIISTLGDTVVSAGIQAGLTGYYQGAMTYDGSPVPLGQASLGLELIEIAGDVRVRADPNTSLLFPEVEGRATTGSGRFAAGDGLIDLTIWQRIEATIAGKRNYLARPVVRQVRLLLRPGASGGALEGTFEETVLGLFGSAVRATGSVALTVVAGRPPGVFAIAPPVQPPPPLTLTSFLTPREALGWTGPETTCADVARLACTLLPESEQSGCRSDPRASAPAIVAASSTALLDALAQLRTDGPARYTELSGACRAAIEVTSSAGYTAAARKCGMPAPLACTLEQIRNRSVDPEEDGALFVDALARQLGPPLLVAKDDMVTALAVSLASGNAAEVAQYDRARSALQIAGRWIFQPAVLEYLRLLTPSVARGHDTAPTWPAARAMAELLATTAAIDAESARSAVANSVVNAASAPRDAQEHAVASYLEALALGELLRVWNDVPPSITNRIVGILSPLDRAHAVLVQGDNYFGVPRGYVPFMYSPEDAGRRGSTNFEQILSRATDPTGAISVVAAAEAVFTAERRQYDQDRSLLRRELDATRQVYDAQLHTLCGAPFALPVAQDGAVDWTLCGAAGTGELALLDARARVAEGQVRILQARVSARADQIAVSERTLAKVLTLRAGEISLRLRDGRTINVLTTIQGTLTAVHESLKMSAHANLLNLFVPAAISPVTLVIGLINTGLEAVKNELRRSIEARSAYTGLEIEKLHGLEALQREWIEFNQLAIEAQEAARGLVVTVIERQNLLERARGLFEERQRAIAATDNDPSRDPMVRLIRDRSALDVLASRANAQQALWLAARALSYEINTSLAGLEGAVLNATSARKMAALASCLQSIHAGHLARYMAPQEYSTVISVRRILGITGPRVDEVTGETLSEAAQFRLVLAQQRNSDARGGLRVEFGTTLQTGNGLWSGDVCNDRISTMEAQLIGDGLGDNEAQVNLQMLGTNFVRSCGSDDIVAWEFGRPGDDSTSALAVVQAGVNSFGAARPNSSLFGQAVARAAWRISIPAGDVAPANRDLDLTRIDDIAVRVVHRALPRRPGPDGVSTACLSQ